MNKLIELLKESREFIRTIIILVSIGRLLFVETNEIILIFELFGTLFILTTNKIIKDIKEHIGDD